MIRVLFAACLLLACSAAGQPARAREPTPLLLHKGARVGVVNMMDAELTHFHTSKILTQSFFKTQVVNWPVDFMLRDAVTRRLVELQLVPVMLGPNDALMRNRDEYFVNNSVAKGLPREASRQFAQLAAPEHLDALIVLAPGLNDSSHAGAAVRRALPDYLRGWGFVTSDTGDKPALFNMTQVMLISIKPDSATLSAREWGGAYGDEWVDYVAPANPKQIPREQLDKLQPLFGNILSKQSGRLMDSLSVVP